MSRTQSSNCRALIALASTLVCLAAVRVTSVRAEEVAEGWRSPFGMPRSVSVNPSDGSCWAATGSNVMHLDADGNVLSETDGLWSPRCVAANPVDGACWVADTGNHEVVKLDGAGAETLRVAGFERPQSVTVNPTDGSCWVADARNDEVVHLAADGTELLRIGCYEDPVIPAAEQCFDEPRSVSVNPADNSCWIADTGNDEIVHLAEDGTELLRVGCYEDPLDPAVEKCFRGPGSVSVNVVDDSCWVADTGNNYLVHLAEDGSLLWRGPCFSSPESVSVDPTDGSVWAADTDNNHLVHLDAEGNQLLRQEGYAELLSVSANPTDGSCWVADTGNSQVVHAAANGTELFRAGYMNGPQSVSANELDSSCWVADTENNRVVQLAENGSEIRSTDSTLLGDPLRRPQSVSVNPADPWEQWLEDEGMPEYFTCWTADTENNRVLHALGGLFPFLTWEQVPDLLYPRSISANPVPLEVGPLFGDVWQCWVADTYNGRVVQIWELYQNGEFSGWYGSAMSQHFSTPESVSVNREDGSCWVADSAGNEVAHLTWDGTELFRKACFSYPLSVSVDWTDGSCWIADSLNNQVVRLAEDGAGLWRGGDFSFPQAVSADTEDGTCWVADTMNNQVVHLDTNGTELWRGGSFSQPKAVSVNQTDGSCWVADTGNNQVVHLVILEGRPRAFFTADPWVGNAPLLVTFADSSLRNPTSWSWDFGDGYTSDQQHPSHEYVSQGLYAVTLTASNAHGSDSKTLYIGASFWDLPGHHWAYKEILTCVGAGIVGGYDSGAYQPSSPVTRDQMAVFISRALAGGDDNVPDGPAEATFNDVPNGHWAYKYVEYCVANDIVQGFDPVTYGPTVTVSRDAMAVFISRAVTGGDANVPAGPAEATFDDVPVDQWAYKYVEYCAAEGIVQGYDPVTYGPTITVSRDQMAVFICRAFDLPT
jgi:DNA-binding beta-propeller fold protein YncE